MRRPKLVLLIGATLAVCLLPSSWSLAQTEQRCFPEAIECIGGRFREYWEQQGGLSIFGFPITEARSEVNPDLQHPYRTQWFERERFEQHFESQPPYDVQLGRLGDEWLKRYERDWRKFPKGRPRAGCQFFQATDHTVCEPFLSYWKGHGLEFDGQVGTSYAESLALFGLPLSEPMLDTNGSGDRVLTQWFERARMEYHPSNPDPYKVLLGRLGAELRMSNAQPADDQRIAFVSYPGGLYLINANGIDQKRLPFSRGSISIGRPAWSPNRMFLAFQASLPGQPPNQLFVMWSDGGDPILIATPGAEPSWTADSMQIAYTTSDTRTDGDIYATTGDGGLPTRLTSGPADDRAPDWSPDGQRLLFTSNPAGRAADQRSSGYNLHVMQADGLDRKQLTFGGAHSAMWSPDGSRIVFVSARDGDSEIFIMNADGSNQHALTSNTVEDFSPAWASDGQRLLFLSNPIASAADIIVMNANGSGRTKVGVGTTWAVWSPDSQRIAFVRDERVGLYLYVMDTDGQNQKLIAEGRAPAWAP